MNKILEIRNLSKSYGRRGYQTWVLRDISLDIFQGDFIGIMGPSGAGKTTLLNMLSTLDKPSRGEILLEGENIVEMKNKELSLVRRDKIGFIFQDYNLLDNMTLQDNIALPLSLNGVKTGEISKEGERDCRNFRPGATSGKISLPAFRRTEAAGSQRKSPDHQSQDPLC